MLKDINVPSSSRRNGYRSTEDGKAVSSYVYAEIRRSMLDRGAAVYGSSRMTILN
jgi:hypothetical protein